MGVFLICVGLILLFGDTTVAEEKGIARKTGAVVKGVAGAITNTNGAPSPLDDFWGWFWYNSDGD
jgi:hypothetical protein